MSKEDDKDKAGCPCENSQPMLTEEKHAKPRCAGCGKPIDKKDK